MRLPPLSPRAESFKLSAEEKTAFYRAADDAGISRSEFVRRLLRSATGLPAAARASRRPRRNVDPAAASLSPRVDPALLRIFVGLKNRLTEIAEGINVLRHTGQSLDLAMVHCLLTIIDCRLDDLLDQHLTDPDLEGNTHQPDDPANDQDDGGIRCC